MKKAIVFILIVAIVLVLTPTLIYAKPGWGQIQKDWAGEIHSNNSGLTYEHVMCIDSLKPSTGDIELSGTNITQGLTGLLQEIFQELILLLLGI